MLSKLAFAIFASLIFACSTAQAQFQFYTPSDFNANPGDTNVNGTIDISSDFGQAAGTISLEVTNGFVFANSDGWTVSETQDTTFTVNSIFGLRGLVSHGGNLGSDNGTSGSDSQDGLIAATGEEWTLVSDIDDDYAQTNFADTFLVDYVGDDTGEVESNSQGNFVWESNDAISSFTVFSNNTTALNNNYSVGFIAAVPEPTSLALIGLVCGLAGIRRKRS